MSFSGDLRRTPAATRPPGADPLANLAAVRSRMDDLHQFLSDSVETMTPIGQPQLDLVSSEIAASIHQIIVNGAALISCAQPVWSNDTVEKKEEEEKPSNPNPDPNAEKLVNLKAEEEDDGDYEIIEIDAVELLAEHVHFCAVCGKGFKRDANLRMHMRAHGDQFKTAAALSKPEVAAAASSGGRRTRFSCPYVGCNRNKQHKKFRGLKSAVCVKNHFKRSHCPKMFGCNRCNAKSFSVVADLKSHLKHCGERKWKCCCGTSFSRKDKLFGHMALFEGHMPAVEAEEERGTSTAPAVEGNEKDVFDGFIENYCSEDVWDSPNSGIEGFFNF